MNPNWSAKEWNAMLFEHLRLVENEAILRLTGRYSEDVALFDKIQDQALNMADVMAEGIISQFG